MCNCDDEGRHGDSVESEFTAEAAKLGRETILRNISIESRKAFSAGDDPEGTDLDETSKLFIEGVDKLLVGGLDAKTWSDSQLSRFVHELGWAKVAADVVAAAVARDNDDGSTPANRCQTEYDNCMKTSGCTHSFFCLCCVPCSLQYLGCMRKIVFGGGLVSGGIA